MPIPTEAALKTQIQKIVKLFDQTRLFAGVTATNNWIDLEKDLIDNAETNFAASLLARLASTRSRLDGLLRDIGADLEPLIRTYGEVLAAPESDAGQIFQRIHDDYITNTKRVESRGFVFAAPAAGGSNAGNGKIVRCCVDENGLAIENTHADAKTMRCLADSSSAAEKWEEIFEIRGANAHPDALKLTGSGKVGQIVALSARASNPYLRNPSFSSSTPAGPTAVPTDITNWTATPAVSSANGYEVIGGTGVNGFYRDFPGDTTSLALRLKNATTYTLTQNLETNRVRFRRDVPYLVQVAYRRKASATGTLKLELGANSVTVDISTKTNDEWNVLRLGVNADAVFSSLDLNKDVWFKNFGEAALDLTLTVTSLATGQLDLDDVVISPLTPFDALWYAAVGTPESGNPVQWKLFDTFSWTDNEYEAAIVQPILFRGFGRYLPAIPAPPPTGLLAADGAAGNVNGTVLYKITFIDKNGVESGGNATATSHTTVNKQISLTSIDTGGTHIAKRRVYRTTNGGAVFKLLTNGTINDNSTTTLTDNDLDASLGATIPADISLNDPS